MIRMILMLMSVILLLILLEPRWSHNLPGRSPSLVPGSSNNTALIIQASCLPKLHPESECRFQTDPNAHIVTGDVWSIFILLTVVALVFASVGKWADIEHFNDTDADFLDNDDNHYNIKQWAVVIAGQFVCLILSATWAAISLRQFWPLRRWMNNSKLLSDEKETNAISSFGAFVPFFMMIGTFSLLFATSMDGKAFSEGSN